MYYGEIKNTDIANGEGVRVSLFVSGCTHHCKNCFNKETWSFTSGEPFTKEVEDKKLLNCATNSSNISFLSLLGVIVPTGRAGYFAVFIHPHSFSSIDGLD